MIIREASVFPAGRAITEVLSARFLLLGIQLDANRMFLCCALHRTFLRIIDTDACVALGPWTLRK